MTSSLARLAADFANELSALIAGTIGSEARFEAISIEDAGTKVGPGPFNLENYGFELIPLKRSCDRDFDDRVWIKIEFDVALDREEAFLMVRHSAFGLWVKPNPDRTKARPVFRIEYDRDAHSKPKAHVHFHAESAELAWLYGTANMKLPRLEEIHFPVGDDLFRPTVEGLLMFLDREGLFNDWQPNWKHVVDESLDRWRRRQASATARRYPDESAEALRRLGYQVIPPTD